MFSPLILLVRNRCWPITHTYGVAMLRCGHRVCGSLSWRSVAIENCLFLFCLSAPPFGILSDCTLHLLAKVMLKKTITAVQYFPLAPPPRHPIYSLNISSTPNTSQIGGHRPRLPPPPPPKTGICLLFFSHVGFNPPLARRLSWKSIFCTDHKYMRYLASWEWPQLHRARMYACAFPPWYLPQYCHMSSAAPRSVQIIHLQ